MLAGDTAATNRDGIVQDHEIGPSPAGGTFGTVRNNTLGDLDRRYNWETTVGCPASAEPAGRGRRDDVQADHP